MGGFSRRGLIVGGAAAIVPFSAQAETPLLFTPHPLAFVRIQVQGTPAVALLDTGGVRGVQISGNLADTLHLELSETGQTTQRYQNSGAPVRAGVTDVSIDGRSWGSEEVTVAAGDIERIAAQIGQSFDVILGWRFLSREGFVADFTAGTFTIGNGSGQTPLAFDDAHGVPIATARMDASEIGVLIDTGAPSCAIDASLAVGAASDRVTKAISFGARSIETQFRVRDLSALTHGTGAKAVFGLSGMRGARLAFDANTRVLTLD